MLNNGFKNMHVILEGENTQYEWVLDFKVYIMEIKKINKNHTNWKQMNC